VTVVLVLALVVGAYRYWHRHGVGALLPYCCCRIVGLLAVTVATFIAIVVAIVIVTVVSFAGTCIVIGCLAVSCWSLVALLLPLLACYWLLRHNIHIVIRYCYCWLAIVIVAFTTASL
jgi:hypothetical protein